MMVLCVGGVMDGQVVEIRRWPFEAPVPLHHDVARFVGRDMQAEYVKHDVHVYVNEMIAGQHRTLVVARYTELSVDDMLALLLARYAEKGNHS